MKHLLANGCYRSKLSVTPTNWNTTKASIKKPWKIHYRFYDPSKKGTKQWGYAVAIRGMNELHTLAERQVMTKVLLQEEQHRLDNEGYNPILKRNIELTALLPEPELSGNTPLMEALTRAVPKMGVSKSVAYDLKSILKYFGLAAELCKKDQLPIGEVKRKDIKLILAACAKVKDQQKGVWTDNQFNHYRGHLSMIFRYLNEEEILEYNPVEKIAKKAVVRQHKEVLTKEQRIEIDHHLELRDPGFRRYVHIFFHSGARRTELLRVQAQHVDLANQRFRVLIKKRATATWVWKTIKDIAVPYWEELLKDCPMDYFLFSRGLIPGPDPILPEQITRRWKKFVKNPKIPARQAMNGKLIVRGGLGINVDFYSIKHLHTTEVIDLLERTPAVAAVKEAAEHNSHTSDAMVVKIYDVKQDDRKHKKIKKLGNPFA